MAKISKKTIQNIFNDFKDSLFITQSLEKFKVNHVDFFEYLNNNLEANKEYKKIEEYNNFIKEERIAEKVYSGDFSKTILLEMIKANNKKKYTQKLEIENTNKINELSEEELDKKIIELQNKLNNK